MSHVCGNFTIPTPIIYILRYQDLSEGFKEGETVVKQDTLLLYTP